MRRWWFLPGLMLCISSTTFVMCQPQGTAPRLEDFPVKGEFLQRPAQPVITANDRHFRTQIQEAAKKGPNFAGHYTIVDWGCGSGCVSFVVVDAVSGRVRHVAPFAAIGIPYQGTADGRDYHGLVYRLNSSLLVADGCPENADSTDENFEKNCGTRYYEWKQNRFVLVANVAVPAAAKK
jgi:hypothetical protein